MHKVEAANYHKPIEDNLVELLEKSQQEVAKLVSIVEKSIEETDPEEVFWLMLWNRAAAYLDDMLEHGLFIINNVIESEVKRCCEYKRKHKLTELPFYRLL